MLRFGDIVFGPIHSRRLGSSLGINLLPRDGKLCNFDCIYCECGWNRDGRVSAPVLPKAADVRTALEKKLAECREAGTGIDSITFSGNGEPTLNPDFPEIISAEESAKHALSGIYTISASDSTASFIMGYHVPDTDLGYLVMLTVTKDGEVSTTEVYWGEPGDSDIENSDTCSMHHAHDEVLANDIQWDSTGMRFLTDNIDDHFWPETVVDTAINNFRIRYKVLYNDQLVPCHDTLLPNRSVFLNVQYNKNLLLNREFRVTDFSDIIPVAESSKYQLSGMIQPESISDSTVSFRLGYYIPDTDLGYPIMLTVTKEGKVLTSLIDEGELGED